MIQVTGYKNLREKVEELDQFHKTTENFRIGSVTSLVGFVVAIPVLMGFIVGLISLVGWLGSIKDSSYEREKALFHTLPAAPHIPRESLKEIVVKDRSPYAEDDSLALYQYTVRFYQEELLTQETEYDARGNRTGLHTLAYDTAGNVLTEQIVDETEETHTYRHIYEYDGMGDMVHEEIDRDGKTVENTYLRYTDEGCAGSGFSYTDDNGEFVVSSDDVRYMEFLTDEEGNPICLFQFSALDEDAPDHAWKLYWQKSDRHLLNYAWHYDYDKGLWMTNQRAYDWYASTGAIEEQFSLYEYEEETAEKHLTMQLNYEWPAAKFDFFRVPSFYLAEYDGDRLLWQMNYVEGKLAYYSVCSYDGEDRLQEALEYDAQGEEPQTYFHRYEYPEEDREEQYTYRIQGKEFRHDFEGNISFTFSDTGIMTETEMTDVSKNEKEIYRFDTGQENAGQLLQVEMGTEKIQGEDGFLDRLEAEAASFGFETGWNQTRFKERSAE